MKDVWTILMAVVMLMVFGGCSSDTEEPDPVLNIYVYAPGKPTLTRSVIDPTEEEKKVNSMMLWVYKSSDGSQLGSITLSGEELESLNNQNSGVYSMPVNNMFARNPEPVDVYVLANVSSTNTGTTFDATISKNTLEDAQFSGGYYYQFVNGGINKAVSKLSDEGLPMSGVIRGKMVTNQNSVLHITDANVRLVRDISKIRFVFSSLNSGDEFLYIDEVKLDANMLYKSDYLFLNDEHPYFRVGDQPLDKEVILVEKLKDANGAPQYVNRNADPRQYAYVSGMDESEYEDLIKKGLEKGELTEAPVVYLPESNKRLTGTVTYHLQSKPSEQRTAQFMMLNGDFRRNQTWIVYVYYAGSSKLEISSVLVTGWDHGGDWEHSVHNW
jgi:hypothetical protein